MVAQPHPIFNVNHMILRMNATVQDFLNLPDDGYRYELIKGVIIRMPPPQHKHGFLTMQISAALIPYCDAHGMQNHLLAKVGYQLWDDNTVLAPDISIVQVAPQKNETYSTVAPLLAVEIASPSQSRPFFLDKAQTFISAGTSMVWVIWQDTKTVDVYTSSGCVSMDINDIISGDAILPEFSCVVSSFFDTQI